MNDCIFFIASGAIQCRYFKQKTNDLNNYYLIEGMRLEHKHISCTSSFNNKWNVIVCGVMTDAVSNFVKLTHLSL